MAERHGLGRSAKTALTLVGTLAVVAIFAPLIAPYDPDLQLDTIALKFRGPSAEHPFGTDGVGRDVLSRVIHGTRMSLLVAAASTMVTLVVGTTYGALAAFAGGIVDSALMRLLDIALSIPRLLILLAIAGIWAPLSLVPLVLLIGLTGWFDVARLVRAETLAVLRREFVLAARATGAGPWHILRRHALPHLLPVLTVSATLGIAHTIGLEVGLSYLGLGVQPPRSSWGTIMNDASGVFDLYWWLTLFPGLAAILAVLACNALGDALRELFASEQVPA